MDSADSIVDYLTELEHQHQVEQNLDCILRDEPQSESQKWPLITQNQHARYQTKAGGCQYRRRNIVFLELLDADQPFGYCAIGYP